MGQARGGILFRLIFTLVYMINMTGESGQSKRVAGADGSARGTPANGFCCCGGR